MGLPSAVAYSAVARVARCGGRWSTTTDQEREWDEVEIELPTRVQAFQILLLLATSSDGQRRPGPAASQHSWQLSEAAVHGRTALGGQAARVTAIHPSPRGEASHQKPGASNNAERGAEERLRSNKAKLGCESRGMAGPEADSAVAWARTPAAVGTTDVPNIRTSTIPPRSFFQPAYLLAQHSLTNPSFNIRNRGLHSLPLVLPCRISREEHHRPEGLTPPSRPAIRPGSSLCRRHGLW